MRSSAPPSLRLVEDLLAKRGIIVSHQTVRGRRTVWPRFRKTDLPSDGLAAFLERRKPDFRAG